MFNLYRSTTAAALAAASMIFAWPGAEAAGNATTRAGLYLTRAQAETLGRAMPGRAVWVDVACCTPGSIDDAVATAEILRIGSGLGVSVPVFVTGSDARHAARAADRIMEAGMPLVFLVTEDDLAGTPAASEAP